MLDFLSFLCREGRGTSAGIVKQKPLESSVGDSLSVSGALNGFVLVLTNSDIVGLIALLTVVHCNLCV